MAALSAAELVDALNDMIADGVIDLDAPLVVVIDGIDHVVAGAIEASDGEAVKLRLEPDRG